MSNPIIKNLENAITSISGTIVLSPSIKNDTDLDYEWFFSTDTDSVFPNIFSSLSGEKNPTLILSNLDSSKHLYWYKLNITNIINEQYETVPVQIGVFPSEISITGLPLYVYANNLTANLAIYPSANYNYTWQQKIIYNEEELNKVDYIPFASGSSNIISLTGLSLADNNSIYNVVVSSGNYSWTSPPITLIVDPNISVLEQNLSDFVLPSGGFKQLFAVARSANGGISYVWEKSIDNGPFSAIVGQNNNFINLSGLTADNVGEKYRLTLNSNISRANKQTLTSATILSAATGLIEILDQSSDSIMISSGINLFVDAQSTTQSNLSYQWLDSNNKIVWNSIVGATGTGLYVPFNGFDSTQTYFKCRISDSSSNILLSDIVEVDNSIATYIIDQPENVTASGSVAQFVCVFFQNQTGVYNYEWYKLPLIDSEIMQRLGTGNNITQTSDNIYTSTLSLSGLNLANNDNDRYVFVAQKNTNKNIGFLSRKALLTVPNTLTVNSGLPDLFRIPVGSSGSLSVNISSEAPPISYEWQKSTDFAENFVSIPGATASTLVINNPGSGDNQNYYRVIVSDTINSIILK
jgi:hypothetical protein